MFDLRGAKDQVNSCELWTSSISLVRISNTWRIDDVSYTQPDSLNYQMREHPCPAD